MRQKVKRRWFACLWTVFLVFLFWWFISVARRNAQAAYSATHQNRGAGTVQLKVIVLEEHQEGNKQAFQNAKLSLDQVLVNLSNMLNAHCLSLTDTSSFRSIITVGEIC